MTYFVLDTNVLLSEGKQALYSFGEDNVVIPMTVMQELDSKKTSPDLGYVARSVLKEILSIIGPTVNESVVHMGNGYGNLVIRGFDYSFQNTPTIPQTSDGNILKTAITLRKESGSEVILVSKDTQFSILARINGLEVRDLIVEDKSELTRHVKKIESYYVDDSEIEDLYSSDATVLDPMTINVPRNIGVILKSYTNPNSAALAISSNGHNYNLVREHSIGKISGKNAEQRIAIQMLQDESIGVVSLTGPAGSGKSLLALSQAINDVESKRREKVIVYRPINAVGGSQQELGFLPGDLDEKMQPHRQAVYDTLEAAVGTFDAKQIKQKNYISVEPVSFVRGRTISNATIIVEEAQNLEYATILTLLTRAGANSRVILVWDMSQKDNQYIQKNDGVYRIVKNLMGDKLFGHVPFHKSERSAISSMAVNLLDEL